MTQRTPDDIVGVTINDGKTVVLIKPDGTPLTAGEVRPGETVKFELRTGMVLRVGRRERYY
jgi:hypothetical protein